MNRITTAIVAMVVATLVAGGGLLVTTTAAEAAAPARVMTAKLVQPGGSGKPIYISGSVQDYRGKNVIIQHRSCPAARCHWVTFKQTKTNKNTAYRTTVTAPKKGRWYWRALVKPRGSYRLSWAVAQGYTYKI